MPLDKQIIPLSLGIGLDSKSDPKQVVSTKLLALQNAVFGMGGAFKKRNGYNSLNSISAGNAIASFKDQLIGFDGFNVNSLSKNQSQFNNVGKKTVVDIKRNVLARHSGNYGFGDLAYISGLYGMIHTINNVMIIDSVTGQEIVNQVVTGTGTEFSTRTQVLGTKFIFVYTTATSIGYFYVDSTAPTVVSAPVVLKTNYNGVCFDCKTINGVLCFVYSDSSNKISRFTLDSSLSVSTQSPISVTPISLGIFEDTLHNVWVGNVVDTGSGNFTVNYLIFGPNLIGLILNQTVIDTVGSAVASGIFNINGIYDGTNGHFFYEISDPMTLYTNNYIKT